MLKSVPANVDIIVFSDNRKIWTEREQNLSELLLEEIGNIEKCSIG